MIPLNKGFSLKVFQIFSLNISKIFFPSVPSTLGD